MAKYTKLQSTESHSAKLMQHTDAQPITLKQYAEIRHAELQQSATLPSKQQSATLPTMQQSAAPKIIKLKQTKQKLAKLPPVQQYAKSTSAKSPSTRPAVTSPSALQSAKSSYADIQYAVVNSTAKKRLMESDSCDVPRKRQSLPIGKAESGHVSAKSTAIVVDKGTACVPAKSTACVPDKSTACVPAKSTACVQAKSTAIVPDKSTAIVPDKSTACVQAKSTAIVQAKSTACVQAKSTAIVPDTSTIVCDDHGEAYMDVPDVQYSHTVAVTEYPFGALGGRPKLAAVQANSYPPTMSFGEFGLWLKSWAKVTMDAYEPTIKDISLVSSVTRWHD